MLINNDRPLCGGLVGDQSKLFQSAPNNEERRKLFETFNEHVGLVALFRNPLGFWIRERHLHDSRSVCRNTPRSMQIKIPVLMQGFLFASSGEYSITKT